MCCDQRPGLLVDVDDGRSHHFTSEAGKSDSDSDFTFQGIGARLHWDVDEMATVRICLDPDRMRDQWPTLHMMVVEDRV